MYNEKGYAKMKRYNNNNRILHDTVIVVKDSYFNPLIVRSLVLLVLFFSLVLLSSVEARTLHHHHKSHHISSIISISLRSALLYTHYNNNENDDKNNYNSKQLSRKQRRSPMTTTMCSSVILESPSTIATTADTAASTTTVDTVSTDDKSSFDHSILLTNHDDQYTHSAFLQYDSSSSKPKHDNWMNDIHDDEEEEEERTILHSFASNAFITKRVQNPMFSARTTTTTAAVTNPNQRIYTTELDFLDNPNNHSDEDIEHKTVHSFSRDRNRRPKVILCSSSTTTTTKSKTTMGQSIQTQSSQPPQPQPRPLVFWENMICGAISRSVAQTLMHPANTMKTILQNTRRTTAIGTSTTSSVVTIRTLMLPQNFQRLTVGAGANFILSVPHGAMNFAVLEFVRKRLSVIVQQNSFLSKNEHKFSFGLDFLSSSISTVVTSIVSTPQMMVVDNIMAGNYPNLQAACIGLAKSKGINGFYAGWWPGLVGKIPSYALTWTFFQQLKKVRNRIYSTTRPIASDIENSAMGCMASAATVCLMIPMDTIKTRLVSQAGRAASDEAYRGIIDCAVRVFREEGIVAFYRGLPPRLVSVVPMIGIQFGVYEFMKRVMIQRRIANEETNRINIKSSQQQMSASFDDDEDIALEEAIMGVAASQNHPNPVPRISKHRLLMNGTTNGKAKSKIVK